MHAVPPIVAQSGAGQIGVSVKILANSFAQNSPARFGKSERIAPRPAGGNRHGA